MNPTKAQIHSVIDQATFDGEYPIIFVGFNKAGESKSFFVGNRENILPLLYDLLGRFIFAPPQMNPITSELEDLSRN